MEFKDFGVDLKNRHFGGETISVADNIATAYESGYTSTVCGAKNNVGNAQVMQDVSDMCLVSNSMDKYGNVFGAQDATLKCVDVAF